MLSANPWHTHFYKPAETTYEILNQWSVRYRHYQFWNKDSRRYLLQDLG
ncbi:hypothetical protein [Planctopirus hydrillae]|nr:hypothetical protein [Planctopirus hydrillae]